MRLESLRALHQEWLGKYAEAIHAFRPFEDLRVSFMKCDDLNYCNVPFSRARVRKLVFFCAWPSCGGKIGVLPKKGWQGCQSKMAKAPRLPRWRV
jgi:hypothetical protein